ncbi:protein adenylyltransferase SelO [Clostridium cylindrosporum]|uniref:protein adenylyltransferase SelO n=1 Tax=Clostridium cylindrosporum TaxID=1495 RepID=UPI00128D5973|nr:YdiU family protein [Clostridium cylindrosporum]
MIDSNVIIEPRWNLDNSYTTLPEAFYQSQKPTPVALPELVILNESLAESLGLEVDELKSEEGIEILAGNKLPEGSIPISQAYAGHQFGYFTMLGDGRAVLLGEQIKPQGGRYDIQLKGSGRTPYSRGGDGRAALGPMLREYIISEAMNALRIPTTRTLAVVKTGEDIVRDTRQPGAVMTRVAISHIRVGTFEYAAQWGSFEDLRELAEYSLERHFPDVESDGNPYLHLLQEVIKNQADLIAKWQLVGFVHGVMNTDNMTISGETIDYGPCAFMDTYDPETVFSSIDTHGRYAYGNQPYIAAWNLARLASALTPLLHNNQDQAVKLAEEAISNFNDLYKSNWLRGMLAKLGLFHKEEEDETLIQELLDIMHKHHADYTNTFRSLTIERPEDTVLFGTEEFTKWYEKWQNRLDKQEEPRDLAYQLMRNSNPSVIPRNHRVEEALEAAVKDGDYSVMKRLLDVLANPFAYSEKQDEYTRIPEASSCRYRTYCGT